MADAIKKWGVLFDMDGTITHSDDLHFNVFQAFFRPYLGFDIDQAFFEANIHGRSNGELFRNVFPMRFTDDELVEMSVKKEDLFCQMVREKGIPEVAGLRDLLAHIRRLGGRVGLVTNAPRTNVNAVLETLQLTSDFEVIVIGDECPRPKPHPDPYLEGCRLLSLEPSQVAVFEDSSSGLRSALAANVAVTMGVMTSLSTEAFEKLGASLAVQDFQDSRILGKLAELAGVKGQGEEQKGI